MKEASITLPSVFSRVGADMSRGIHAQTTRAIVKFFGGATVTHGEGLWTDADGAIVREPVVVYTIAGDNTPDNRTEVRVLARGAALAGKEQAVYYRQFDGEAFIDPMASFSGEAL